MAFYGYNNGEYTYFTIPYDYDDFPIQSSKSYASYEQIQHSTNYNYYYPTQIHQELSYNVQNFSESKIVKNDEKVPNSFSRKENDDTIFEEYDPTPYDGGYDMEQTYGKPLLPSNETCYPRSVPLTSSLEFFNYGSIPSPYMNHDDHQIEEPLKDEEKSLKEKANLDEKPKENVQQDHQDVVVENNNNNNGTIGEYDYNNYGGQVQQIIPYGLGLETIDICESIFGYWPCLEKQKQRTRNINNVEDINNELWENTANYIFGNPYGDGRDGRYWDSSSFSNQNYYYQEQD